MALPAVTQHQAWRHTVTTHHLPWHQSALTSETNCVCVVKSNEISCAKSTTGWSLPTGSQALSRNELGSDHKTFQKILRRKCNARASGWTHLAWSSGPRTVVREGLPSHTRLGLFSVFLHKKIHSQL